MGRERSFASPNMSDTTLLVSVEDLINMAMGPEHVNVVNFKMIQTVLHILARQLRMLETQVEIRISEGPPAPKEKHDKKRHSDYSTDSSSSKSPRKGATSPKSPLKGIKEEKEKATRDKDKEKEIKAAAKEKEKAQKATEKEKEKAARAESKERDKAERATSKEREKAERAESKEREKGEKTAAKDKEKAERAESKEREKGEKAKEKEARAESKEREKAERAESKEREKAEKAGSKDKEKAEKAATKEKEKMEKMDAKDREKAEKEKEKMEKMSAKDREKAEKEKEKMEKMSAKDREKAEKEKEKMEKMSAKEREKAEKEQEKMEKMSAKDREKAEKEKEKLEKMDVKEREKAEKEKEKLEKMDAKDRAKAEKEREKLDKMDAKDREKAIKEKEKAEKAAEKEKEKMDKMSAKEKEKYEKELAKQKAKEEKEQAKSGKDKTGISIKEKDKVLVVEKGPTSRSDSRSHVGSIEVVTVSQFELLEAIVNDLKDKAGPLPLPALPDNEKLRAQLAQGSASLTDTMQAMQVKARVQAAEAAIGRMAGLLTQLAAAGALPEDVAGTLEDVKAEMNAITEESARPRTVSIVGGGGGGGGGGGLGGASRKSVAIDPMSKMASTTSRADARSASIRQSVSVRPSITSKGSAVSKTASIGQPGVTHVEMDDALRALKDSLTKNMNNLTTKATTAAEGAAAVAKAASGKMEVAVNLNSRVNTLYSLVSDYAEQLSGFDAGLTTQMQSFQEQMVQMRNDLKGGVNLLESANNNAETAAVMELTERYQGLVLELDHTVHEHVTLTTFQKQLGDELRSLLECVEMLREQKADRDEVLDGLRDKADNSRLAGLLTELEFAASRSELDRRLDLCYEKFAKQEQVWMSCIKDLTDISEGKAEIMQLLAAKEDAQQQLRVIQERLQRLAIILGEPKAAMLTRQLSKGARCGSCQVPALQDPFDASAGKPPLLPCFRPPPLGEEQPCVPEWKPAPPPDDRQHTCHRWVGGSHTLVSESVAREQAGPLQVLGPPTRRYAGLGPDGRLYMMEETLQPCAECNMISTDKAPEESIPGGNVTPVDGGGDIELHMTQTIMELPP